MKTTFLSFCLLFAAVAVHAQSAPNCCTPLPDDPLYELTASPGSLTYTVSLSGDPIFYGLGTFTRNGNLLGYELRTIPEGYRVAEIRAPVGSPGNQVLFSLRRVDCFAPAPDSPGSCIFRGTLMLSDPQIAELDSGQWMVRSVGPDPMRFIEGPIVLVPEPSTWFLFLVGGVVCWLCWRWRSQEASKPCQNGRDGTSAESANMTMPKPCYLLIRVCCLMLATPSQGYEAISTRPLLTNGPPIYFNDASVAPFVAAAVPQTPQSPVATTNFTGFREEHELFSGNPPDTHGAVGTNALMTMLNPLAGAALRARLFRVNGITTRLETSSRL